MAERGGGKRTLPAPVAMMATRVLEALVNAWICSTSGESSAARGDDALAAPAAGASGAAVGGTSVASWAVTATSLRWAGRGVMSDRIVSPSNVSSKRPLHVAKADAGERDLLAPRSLRQSSPACNAMLHYCCARLLLCALDALRSCSL